MSTTPRKQEPAWPSGALARETIRLRRVHIGRMSARFLAIAHALDDAADAMLAACVKAEHRGDHYHDSHDDPVKKAVYEARDKVFERAMLYLQTELREKDHWRQREAARSKQGTAQRRAERIEEMRPEILQEAMLFELDNGQLMPTHCSKHRQASDEHLLTLVQAAEHTGRSVDELESEWRAWWPGKLKGGAA